MPLRGRNRTSSEMHCNRMLCWKIGLFSPIVFWVCGVRFSMLVTVSTRFLCSGIADNPLDLMDYMPPISIVRILGFGPGYFE
jgi:hypothetical protein